MEKQKVSPKILAFLIISIILLVIAIPVFTYAWFTDSKSYSNTLSFGEISLDVKSGVNETAKTVTFNVTRTNGSYATGGKIYPGDTVNISIGLSVKSTSGPAYYLIYLTDSKGYFQEGAYFSDGTNVYFNNGIKTINQATSAEVTNKYVGAIASSSVTHTVNMKAIIDTALNNATQNTSTDITLNIYAIQQYNLTESDAQGELNYLCYGITKEYSKVRYLQSSGTEFIDTGVVATTAFGFEIDFTPLNTIGGGHAIFGSLTGSDNQIQLNTYQGSGNGGGSMYLGDGAGRYTAYMVKNQRTKISFKDNMFTTSNGSVSATFGTANTNTIYVFARNDGTKGATETSSARIYNFKMYNGNTLERNFIACIRKSDSKPGLYDTVNKVFYSNGGSGEFAYA